MGYMKHVIQVLFEFFSDQPEREPVKKKLFNMAVFTGLSGLVLNTFINYAFDVEISISNPYILVMWDILVMPALPVGIISGILVFRQPKPLEEKYDDIIIVSVLSCLIWLTLPLATGIMGLIFTFSDISPDSIVKLLLSLLIYPLIEIAVTLIYGLATLEVESRLFE